MSQPDAEGNQPEDARGDFAGLRVAAFESRRAAEMERMIERLGGKSLVSPSLREVPLEKNLEAVEFAHRLITGEIGVVVFLTGVGFRMLLAAIEKHVPRQRYLDGLTDIVTIARGPKPVAAMREVGLTPTHRVPPPNTWRDILNLVDQSVPVVNQTVALQEYGVTNQSLIAGLEARGATVINVPVYRWELPLDCGPLEANARALASQDEVDVVLFTSAHQVVNLMQVARQLGIGDAVRAGLRRAVVGSIGPTTSETLQELEISVDFEPEHAKMGHLVATAATRCHSLMSTKARLSPAIRSSMNPAEPLPPWHNSPFLKACRGEPTDVTPVWLMRQAGRYMEEYRRVREKTTFLGLCGNPQLCSEVMCTAVQRLGVDAAIIFSDLLPILQPMGLDLEFTAGEGPVIHNPLRTTEDVDRFRELESMEQLEFVTETVRQTRRDLPDHLPLIGFSGAPFTLASYAIEGGSSRNYLHTKQLMYRDSGAWHAIMLRLARAVSLYLTAQIDAGAQCVQIFDSWAGCLGPDDYRRYVLPYQQQIVSSLPPDVPVINFATGNPALLPLLAEGGTRVVGLDWRVRLEDGWETVGFDRSVQGNLDPTVLLADRSVIRRHVQEILDQAADRPGHIFNLGHGVLQQTPVENAIALVDAVHELSSR
jgi:uroporphyrinogen decarboxylase